MVGPSVRKRSVSFSAVLCVIWLIAFAWVRDQPVSDFWKIIFYLGCAFSAEAVLANAGRLPARPAWAPALRRIAWLVASASAWPASRATQAAWPLTAGAAALYVILFSWQFRRRAPGGAKSPAARL